VADEGVLNVLAEFCQSDIAVLELWSFVALTLGCKFLQANYQM